MLINSIQLKLLGILLFVFFSSGAVRSLSKSDCRCKLSARRRIVGGKLSDFVPWQVALFPVGQLQVLYDVENVWKHPQFNERSLEKGHDIEDFHKLWLEFFSLSRCAEWTNNELEIIIRECAAKIEKKVSLFPNLLKEILHLVREMLHDGLETTNIAVGMVLDSELAYVNFKHPNFVEAYNQLVNPNGTTSNDGRKSNGGSESEQSNESQCEAVKELVESYFVGVRDQMKNIIPKITVRFLIFEVKNNLQEELVEKLNQSELLDDLLYEEKCIPLRRKEADEMLTALSKAQKIIGEIDHHRV